MPEEVKKRRNNDLLAIQNGISLLDHRGKIGETVEVLVEGPSKNAYKHDHGPLVQLTGRTMTDHIVCFDGNERLTGHTVQVKIDEATSFTLFGTVVTGERVGVADHCYGPESLPLALLPETAGKKPRIELPLLSVEKGHHE